jgi:hypothetical protein
MARTFVCRACSANFPASIQQVGITVSCPACGSQCQTPSATEDEDFRTVHLIPTLEGGKCPDPLSFAQAVLSEWWGGIHDRGWALDGLADELRGLTLAERKALAAKLLDHNDPSASTKFAAPHASFAEARKCR